MPTLPLKPLPLSVFGSRNSPETQAPAHPSSAGCCWWGTPPSEVSRKILGEVLHVLPPRGHLQVLHVPASEVRISPPLPW